MIRSVVQVALGALTIAAVIAMVTGNSEPTEVGEQLARSSPLSTDVDRSRKT